MNLYMDEYTVMPNHFHSIIIIGENKYNSQRGHDKRGMENGVGRAMERGTKRGTERRDAMHRVSTPNTPNTPTNNPAPPKNQFGPQRKNLSYIMRGFKSALKVNAREINPEFAWQSRFYDHVIRNNAEFQRIRNYIKNNPKNWKDDTFYG